MGQWLDSLTGWLSANPQWLGLAIFLVACIECLAIAGIIVPGTVLLFAVAVLAGSGTFSLGETLLLGFLGGLVGDALSYTVGKYFHQNIRRLPLLRHHPEWIGSAEAFPALRHRQPAGRAFHRAVAADAADGRRHV